ncbi:7409_t:CDS:2, partial [Acaulospora morrowiae]
MASRNIARFALNTLAFIRYGLEEESAESIFTRSKSAGKCCLKYSTTLARTIQQVYDSISIDSIAHVMVNDYIDLSLQVSPLAPTFQSTEGDMTGHEYDHYPIIAPYHTLLLLEDPEEILRSIPIDANPTLVNLIQILTPTKR